MPCESAGLRESVWLCAACCIRCAHRVAGHLEEQGLDPDVAEADEVGRGWQAVEGLAVAKGVRRRRVHRERRQLRTHRGKVTVAQLGKIRWGLCSRA